MKLGVYIQVPFCQTKCTYCNFHTGVFAKSLYDPYVNALCREIAEHAALYQTAGVDVGASFSSPGSVVDTIYIGGGTPSLLAPAALARILDRVRGAFLCQLEEVTLEADPETVTPEKAAAWRAAGINRVSLGVQSFQDAELKAAGRMHRRADIFAAAETLRACGFENISFDLIAGLPHQTNASWEDSLENLIRLRPEHVSVYLLEIDEGSRLGREVLSLGQRYSARALPSEDDMASFYERGCERLAAAGYDHYEISNWALRTHKIAHCPQGPRPLRDIEEATLVAGLKPRPAGGYRSMHNLKYWRREAYLGFGAGAHSFDGRVRWANAHDPGAYVAAIEQGRLPIEQREELTPQQALEEELFLGLRQLDGINVARIEQQYQVSLGARLAGLRDAGLIEMDGQMVRLAPARLTISNEVFVELLG